MRRQVKARLGFEPQPGTLNVRLGTTEQAAFDRLKAAPGVLLEPQPGFCAARCFPVLLEGRVKAAVVWPQVEGYPRDQLELLAPVRLRDELGLRDGSPITIVVPS